MKIVAIISSGRKQGNSFRFAKRMEERMKATQPNVTFEYVQLSDASIAPCIGCRACFDRGEENCPHKDDIPAIAKKLLEADGVVFSTPTYVGSMSGYLKNMLDRLAYFCHRPAFFGKFAVVISTTGTAAAKMAVYSVRFPLGSMGFRVAGSSGFTLRTGKVIDVPDAAGKRLDKLADALTRSVSSGVCKPTIFGLVSFYLNRAMYTGRDKTSFDHDYFERKGWLKPDCQYFTDARPTLFQKIAARFIALLIKST